MDWIAYRRRVLILAGAGAVLLACVVLAIVYWSAVGGLSASEARVFEQRQEEMGQGGEWPPVLEKIHAREGR